MDLIPIAMRKAALLLLLAGVACACVSNKKFNSMKAEALRLDGELNSANTRIDDLTRRNDTLTAKNLRLVSDSTRLYMSYTALHATRNSWPTGRPKPPACSKNSRRARWPSTSVRGA